MTLTEKAIAYDKAVKLAKSYYDKGTNEFLDTIFPELKKSDEERMKEDIMEAVENWFPYERIEEIRAYLYIEKQKEQKEQNPVEIHIDNPNIQKFNPDVKVTTSDSSAGGKELLYVSNKSYNIGFRDGVASVKPVEYLDKDKVYAIMTKLTNLSCSQLIPINSDEFKKLHEITSEVRDLLDYPIEQKHTEWSEEDKGILLSIKCVIDSVWHNSDYDCSKEELKKMWNWLDTLWQRVEYPQSKQEWSEDWQEEDTQTRFAFYTYKDDQSVLYLSNVFVEETSRNHGFGTRILKAAEKVAETIGATTIRLKVKQDSPANAWYRKNGYSYMTFEDGYDWLEKNLEYLKSVKQEWNEEDTKRVKQLIYDTEHIRAEYEKRKKELGESFNDALIKDCDEQIAWLKAFHPQSHKEIYQAAKHDLAIKFMNYLDENRPEGKMCLSNEECEDIDKAFKENDWTKIIRYVEKYRPSWKPSEEQMNRLFSIVAALRKDYCDDMADFLASIYHDIKKLM